MNSDPGWSTSGQWAFGVPTGGGGAGPGNNYDPPDPTSGYTGANVYGYNLNGNYENSINPAYWLTTPAIDCSGHIDTKLSFQRWLGVEQPAYDHVYLEISTNGTTWSTLWQNTATMDIGAWTNVQYDISTVADGQSTVYFRWGMGPTDGSYQYCGWNIDDVALSGMYAGTDIDGDGIPDDWETFYYGGATNASSSAMASNGVNTVLQAYIAGLNPTNPAAFFTLDSLGPLQWSAVSGRVYTIYWTSNLLNGFGTPWKTNITDGSYTDTTHAAEEKSFYKIEVELE